MTQFFHDILFGFGLGLSWFTVKFLLVEYRGLMRRIELKRKSAIMKKVVWMK